MRAPTRLRWKRPEASGADVSALVAGAHDVVDEFGFGEPLGLHGAREIGPGGTLEAVPAE